MQAKADSLVAAGARDQRGPAGEVERVVCHLGDERDRVDDHRDVQLQPEFVESIFDSAHHDEPNRLDVRERTGITSGSQTR
jgi:hypothetical protein